MPIVDTSSYYEAALRRERIPLNQGAVQPGYWRMRDQNKVWSPPYAIFWTNNKLMVKEGNNKAYHIHPEDEQRWFDDLFTWMARFPISPDMYWRWRRTGSYDEMPEVGHNNPDTVEEFRDQIIAADPGINITVTSDQIEQELLGRARRLQELAGLIEKKHAVEKKPYLDRSRAIDQKWLPLSKEARAKARALADAVAAYESKKAETLKQHIPEKVQPTYGRAVRFKESPKVLLVDQDAAYAIVKDDMDVGIAIRAACQRLVDAGMRDIPGIEIKMEVKAA